MSPSVVSKLYRRTCPAPTTTFHCPLSCSNLTTARGSLVWASARVIVPGTTSPETAHWVFKLTGNPRGAIERHLPNFHAAVLPLPAGHQPSRGLAKRCVVARSSCTELNMGPSEVGVLQTPSWRQVWNRSNPPTVPGRLLANTRHWVDGSTRDSDRRRAS